MRKAIRLTKGDQVSVDDLKALANKKGTHRAAAARALTEVLRIDPVGVGVDVIFNGATFDVRPRVVGGMV